ncbi:MAG TPA: phosphopantetheine-binding protein, partial [Blastocatellia bacterium]|nr:phosphopantetheine-binding protein [Blastocatellia bacterium]
VLVGYVVLEDGVSEGEVREELRGRLPEYMVPQAVVRVERMPLTPNGKIDRRALPMPEAVRPELEAGYAEPRTAMEEVLVELWGEVLKVEKVGIHTNFFSLGGHSLLATQLISRVRDTFQVDLPLKKFFERPTVAGLAATITESQAEQADEREMAQLLAQLEQLSDEEAEVLLADHAAGPDRSKLLLDEGSEGQP